MASGHVVPHQQAGHMAAPTSLAPPLKKTLANGEPSTHGTTQTWDDANARSARTLKADILDASKLSGGSPTGGAKPAIFGCPNR